MKPKLSLKASTREKQAKLKAASVASRIENAETPITVTPLEAILLGDAYEKRFGHVKKPAYTQGHKVEAVIDPEKDPRWKRRSDE